MATRFRKVLFVTVPLAVAAVAIVAAQEPSNPAAAVLKSQIMVTPAEVQWGACSPALPPGAQCVVLEGDPKAANVLFSYRLKMPNGYKLAPHFHPAVKATKAMVAGSFVVMPKGTHHFAWTTGETILQVYAIGPWALTYVNANDDPRNQKKPAA